jgi:hypothetical protein
MRLKLAFSGESDPDVSKNKTFFMARAIDLSHITLMQETASGV